MLIFEESLCVLFTDRGVQGRAQLLSVVSSEPKRRLEHPGFVFPPGMSRVQAIFPELPNLNDGPLCVRERHHDNSESFLGAPFVVNILLPYSTSLSDSPAADLWAVISIAECSSPYHRGGS